MLLPCFIFAISAESCGNKHRYYKNHPKWMRDTGSNKNRFGPATTTFRNAGTIYNRAHEQVLCLTPRSRVLMEKLIVCSASEEISRKTLLLVPTLINPTHTTNLVSLGPILILSSHLPFGFPGALFP